jgi:uncharacterized membrane protein YtjA (UPF0391 family)
VDIGFPWVRQLTRRVAELFRSDLDGTKMWRFGLWGGSGAPAALHQESIMLGWAITFLIVALVAALFGFGGIAAVAVDAAKIIFFVAIILFVVSAVIALVRGRSPTVP